MTKGKPALRKLSPQVEWYLPMYTMEGLVAKLKWWSKKIDPEKYKDKGEEEYIHAKRRYYLMKIMILRTHGILATDFEGFENHFLRSRIRY